MSRLFDDGSNEYLERDSAVISAYPLTMACWVNSDDATVDGTAIFIGNSGAHGEYWALIVEGARGGDPFKLWTRQAGLDSIARTTTGFTVNTWHHCCAVGITSTNKSVFIDGGSKGTSVVDRTPQGVNRISIGRAGDVSPSLYMSGQVAQPTVWNVALSDFEVDLLAKDVHPFLIRPQNIIAYWPLVHDDLDRSETNLAARFHLTPFNGPSFAPHPPKIRRVAPLAAQFIETGELYEMSEPLSHFDFTLPVRRIWPVLAPTPPVGQPTPIRTQGVPTGSGYRDRIGGWN